MPEDKHISNGRYRVAFMRGFERGAMATIGQLSDYIAVYPIEDKELQERVTEAYNAGYKCGYDQRKVAYHISNDKYPFVGEVKRRLGTASWEDP